MSHRANDGPPVVGPVLACPSGPYSSIRAAVNAALPGDWILVAPGDYHEKANTTAGVYITTAGIHLRGMDRNGVVVDGTQSSAITQCSSAPTDQDTNGGNGRNGIEVYKADGTYIENLTTSGLCPSSTTMSCTLIIGNHVHDSNNPNAPGSGIASAAPIGAGIELSEASFHTVLNNIVDDQKGGGIVTHDYPDTETPPSSGVSSCQGGVSAPGVCTFLAQGNVITGNTLSRNGGFGNPSNGDLANESTASSPRNCFYSNTDPGGLTSDPAMIQTVDGPPCGTPGGGDSTVLAAELVCASGAYASCPPGITGYPQSTGVQLVALAAQQTMHNPCAGVPDNPWCASGQLVGPPAYLSEVPLLLLFPITAAGVIFLRRRRPQAPRTPSRSAAA